MNIRIPRSRKTIGIISPPRRQKITTVGIVSFYIFKIFKYSRYVNVKTKVVHQGSGKPKPGLTWLLTWLVTLVILSLELKPYYILLEGYRARPPGPEPQLEDSYTGRLLTSRRDTIAYGTIPYRA